VQISFAERRQSFGVGEPWTTEVIPVAFALVTSVTKYPPFERCSTIPPARPPMPRPLRPRERPRQTCGTREFLRSPLSSLKAFCLYATIVRNLWFQMFKKFPRVATTHPRRRLESERHRVSTIAQNLALQRDALAEVGCGGIFTEQLSGR
jgi:hypothetical protein